MLSSPFKSYVCTTSTCTERFCSLLISRFSVRVRGESPSPSPRLAHYGARVSFALLHPVAHPLPDCFFAPSLTERTEIYFDRRRRLA